MQTSISKDEYAMIKNNHSTMDPPASLGVIEPHARLLAGVLAQTFFDLRSNDPLKSIDALLFFMDPEGAETYLDAMGYQMEPYKILGKLLGGDIHAQKSKFKRFAIQHIKQHVRKGKTSICPGVGKDTPGLYKTMCG